MEYDTIHAESRGDTESQRAEKPEESVLWIIIFHCLCCSYAYDKMFDIALWVNHIFTLQICQNKMTINYFINKPE